MPQKPPNPPFWALPNLISLLRCFLVPLIVVLVLERDFAAAFGCFIVAGASDGLDGYLARRFHLQSPLGAMLDPLADKALLVSLYATLAVMGIVPVALAIVVIARDVAIVSGIVLVFLLGRPMTIAPARISKLNTVVQIIYIILVLFNLAVFGSAPPAFVAMRMAIDICGLCVGVLTFASATVYGYRLMVHFEPKQP